MKPWISLCLFIFGGPLFACRNPCKIPKLADAYRSATQVFLAEVMGKKVGTEKNTFALRAERSWKGEPLDWADVTAPRSTCDPFADATAIGAKVLVFATEAGGVLTTGTCAGATSLSDAEAGRRTIVDLDALAAANPRMKTAIVDPPKDPQNYQAWGNSIFSALASCQADADCKTVFFGCPWGCGTALNRRADADQILRVVRGYPGNPCKYQCAERLSQPRCVKGTCQN